MAAANQKEQAHHMLDQLDAGQLGAVVHLLEVMTDPVARALANAPVEDEPISEKEERAAEEAKAWLKTNKPIPHQEVLAELGLTPEDVRRFAETMADDKEPAR